VAAPDPKQPEIARTFEFARTLTALVSAARTAGRLPMVVAGNCNSCLGTVTGLRSERLGVVWFDAHADFDTPEDNQSGFLDVMALSTLTGACWRTLRRSIRGFREFPEWDVILVGVRDLEPYQRARLETSRVRALSGDLIHSASVEAVLERPLDDLHQRAREIYLHVDLDVLNPSEGRANEHASPGGLSLAELEQALRLSLAELEQALRLVGSCLPVMGAAITAYNPRLRPKWRNGEGGTPGWPSLPRGRWLKTSLRTTSRDRAYNGDHYVRVRRPAVRF
jgi:arginase